MSLANFYRKVREARISREWRVTFGIWVVLATVAISAASIKAIPYWVVIIFAISAILFEAWWLSFHFGQHEDQAKRMYSYRDRAARLLMPDDQPPRKRNALFVPLSEWLITVFLSIAVLIANWFR
jgi:hypothetical protein